MACVLNRIENPTIPDAEIEKKKDGTSQHMGCCAVTVFIRNAMIVAVAPSGTVIASGAAGVEDAAVIQAGVDALGTVCIWRH
jgi:hypothetical protein